MGEREIAAAILAGPDAIVAADADGVVTFWNAGAERIFGHPAAEAVGASLDLIIPERLRERHWQGWAQLLATGRGRHAPEETLNVPSVHRDGTPLSIEFTVHPLHGPDGSLQGVAATLRDATARFEQMRELRRRLADSPG